MEEEKDSIKIYDGYWVYSENETMEYPDYGSNCGKWMIFPHVNDLSYYWKIIQEDIAKGNLTSSAKCSTMKINKNARSDKFKLICIYTYDYLDKKDVMRVAKRLYEIGIKGTLRYKADLVTLKNKYSKNGDLNISEYVVTKKDLIKSKFTFLDFN